VAASEALRDPAYLQMAVAAGDATYDSGDVRGNASQCHGLAGNAELFMELYQATADRGWLARAHVFARQAFAYCTEHP
jgi:hypothetical protein